jgi:UDP-glucose 4-epimerase
MPPAERSEAMQASSIPAGAEWVTTTAAITGRTVQSCVMTTTILVTGGAGYIGSHTVHALRRKGRQVVVLDTLERGPADAVLDAPLVVGDIADRELVSSVLAEHEVDTIIHFAAYKNVGESMREPSMYFRNNVDSTVTLLDAAVAAGVDRVVFSSSCSVYGTPDVVPVDETQPIHPESVYAETKAMVERVLHWYSETRGLRSVSLRYFNAAGASLDSPLGEDWTYALNLIPVAIRAMLLGGERLQVFGDDYPTPDGTCIRDYIHVDDLALAHIAAVEYLAGGGATTAINVGTGTGTSVQQVLDAIERVAGQSVPYDIVPRRAGDPMATYADTTRAREVLGWTAQHGLREIIESAYRWHQQQLSKV